MIHIRIKHIVYNMKSYEIPLMYKKFKCQTVMRWHFLCVRVTKIFLLLFGKIFLNLWFFFALYDCKDVRNRHSNTLLAREQFSNIYRNWIMHTPCDSIISLLGIYLPDIIIQGFKEFMRALFRKVKSKKPTYPWNNWNVH